MRDRMLFVHVLIISLLCEALRSSRVIFHNKCYNNSITAMPEQNKQNMTPEKPILPFDKLPGEFESKREPLLDLDKEMKFELRGQSGDAPNKIDMLIGVRLGAEREYKMFQDVETWANRTYGPLDPEKVKLPDYCEGLSDLELDRLGARRELINAANWKRFPGEEKAPTLEHLSKNIHLANISRTETITLIDIPGVWEALKEYVQLMDDDKIPEDLKRYGVNFTFREAKTNEQLMYYRLYVRMRIRDQVVLGREGKLDKTGSQKKFLGETRSYCKDAEQVAFNLHFIANFFEAEDSKWEKDRLQRKPEMVSTAVSVPVKGAMNPLETMVNSALRKDRASLTEVGAFGLWSHRRIEKSIAKLAGLRWMSEEHRARLLKGKNKSEVQGYDDGLREFRRNLTIDEIRILPNIKENEDKFWTIDKIDVAKGDGSVKKGYRLNVFEAYPRNFLRSAWEEVKVDDKNGDESKKKKTMLDYLRDNNSTKEEMYKALTGQDIWGGGGYSWSLNRAAAVWDLYRKKSPLYTGKGGGGDTAEWVNTVQNTLSFFNLRTNEDILKGVLYASVGVDPDKNAPKISADRQTIEMEMATVLGYMDRYSILYPWDKPSRAERIFT